MSAIKELKAHVLRSKNQDRARTNITENLGDGDLFLVADWAMKFLPRKFREGQTDWFGKRGINWHIAVCATKKNDSYCWTHICIFWIPSVLGILNLLQHY